MHHGARPVELNTANWKNLETLAMSYLIQQRAVLAYVFALGGGGEAEISLAVSLTSSEIFHTRIS